MMFLLAVISLFLIEANPALLDRIVDYQKISLASLERIIDILEKYEEFKNSDLYIFLDVKYDVRSHIDLLSFCLSEVIEDRMISPPEAT